LSTEPHQDFRRAIDGPEDKIDLGSAALTMVISEYPNLDVKEYLTRLDRIGVAVSRRLGEEITVYRVIAAINCVLFNDLGFKGNRENYYDPKNSFLNEVIERKTGIPITLSLLYMEVAERVGLALQGVGFPGHFLVKYPAQSDDLVIDPFNTGEIRSRESLQKMLRGLYGDKVEFQPSFLLAVTKKQILKRILNNLKLIYFKANDLWRTLSVMQRLVILEPDSAEEIRDRGLVYLKLECFRQALSDLENYLSLAPDAADKTAIKEQIVRLTKQVQVLH